MVRILPNRQSVEKGGPCGCPVHTGDILESSGIYDKMESEPEKGRNETCLY